MDTVEVNSAKAWILAARPKTLAAAVVPVLVGSALSVYWETVRLSIGENSQSAFYSRR